jgi:membrane AbrB-like protein
MTLRDTLGRVRHSALIFAGALVFGVVAQWLRFPLPWMLGAMLFSMTVRMLNLPVRIPVQTRQLGQVLVASSVGLSFTPEALQVMGSLLAPMVLAAIVTIFIGFGVAAVLMWLTRVEAITAILASLPMGPVESAVLAEKHNVPLGPIVFAQTLRIIFLVVLIPPLIVLLDGTISDPVAVLRNVEWNMRGALILFAFGLGGALIARKLGLGNPFFIGALAGAAICAALTLPISPFPYPVLACAQVFLGIWLGAVFDRDLIRRARGFIPGCILTSLLLVCLCAAMGVVLTYLTGQPWQVMVLATAPGSVTEMALTAKILQEGLALVTAFHLVRIFIILPFAPLIISFSARAAARWGL